MIFDFEAFFVSGVQRNAFLRGFAKSVFFVRQQDDIGVPRVNQRSVCYGGSVATPSTFNQAVLEFVYRGVSKRAAAFLVYIGFLFFPRRGVFSVFFNLLTESELPADLEPYRIHIPIEQMHHVQAAASLFVGESATMASESVCLATPAIYIDQVGRGYTDEEARESLLWMFRPVKDRSALQESEPTWISGGVEECILCAESIAQSLANASNHGLDHFESPSHYGLDAFPFDPTTYAKRHQSWLSTKIDCTAFLTYFIENYPQSVDAVRMADKSFWEKFK